MEKLTPKEATENLVKQMRNMAHVLEAFLLEDDRAFNEAYHYMVITQLKELEARAKMIQYEISIQDKSHAA